MNGTTMSLVLSVAFLLLLVILGFIVVLRLMSQQESRYQSSLLSLSESHAASQKQQNQLLNKTITLLSTKDPLAFQQVQAMETQESSPSEYISQDPIALAYAEAVARGGYIYDPDSLDGDIYDAEDLARLYGADGSLPTGGTIAGHD